MEDLGEIGAADAGVLGGFGDGPLAVLKEGDDGDDLARDHGAMPLFLAFGVDLVAGEEGVGGGVFALGAAG